MQESQTIPNSPWWFYLLSIGFIMVGIYFLKKFKEVRPLHNKGWDYALKDWYYLMQGLLGVLSGSTFLIISILRLFGYLKT